MNRAQARTILWALGSPTSEQNRAEAVGVVLDLLMDPERLAAKDLAQKDREIQRLTSLTDEMRGLWERVEQLVGREFTSPESTIDRVAVLASADKHRNEAVQENEKLAGERTRLREELSSVQEALRAQVEAATRVRAERDELLAAVREYLASPGEHPRRLLQRRYDDIVAPLP